MEDRTVCKLEDCFVRPHGFFSVFDGHGGCETAVRLALPARLRGPAACGACSNRHLPPPAPYFQDHCAECLHRNMLESQHFPDFLSALQDAYLRTDASFLRWAAMSNRKPRESNAGAAGLTCVITSNHLALAHAGDCRAILVKHESCSEAYVDLTRDHAADDLLRADEMARVRGAGAQTQQGYVFVGEHNLPMTRAFGNLRLKVARGSDWRSLPVSAQVVTALPEVCTYARCPDDLAVVLASDGLFGDVLSSAEVASLTREVLMSNAHTGDAENIAARRLVEAAIKHQSSDNVSVVVISLESPDYLPKGLAPPTLCCSSSDGSISTQTFSPGRMEALNTQVRVPFAVAYPSAMDGTPQVHTAPTA
jgi:serine/threonine protein phosphatase PrpC